MDIQTKKAKTNLTTPWDTQKQKKNATPNKLQNTVRLFMFSLLTKVILYKKKKLDKNCNYDHIIFENW